MRERKRMVVSVVHCREKPLVRVNRVKEFQEAYIPCETSFVNREKTFRREAGETIEPLR